MPALACVAALVQPPGSPLLGYSPRGDGTGLTLIPPEVAHATMATWSEVIMSRPGVYPECAHDACVRGIHLSAGRHTLIPPFNTLMVFSCGVMRGPAPVSTHLLLTMLDPVVRTVSVLGIVESPYNVQYGASVMPHVDELSETVQRARCRLNIEPLSRWAGGVFWYALTHKV